MRVNVPNSNRSTAKATSITRSQRSSCVVQVFRYDKLDITKMTALNASDEKSLAGSTKSTSGNLNIKQTLVIKNDVIRCSISKNKGNNDGNFSVTLKKGKQVKDGRNLNESIDYIQSVHPGDWIAIYLKKSGDISDTDLNNITPESGFKFLGIIESVRVIEIDNPISGTPRLEYIVTGREFGKVFDMSLFFNPQVNKQTIETILGAKFLTDSSNTVKPIGGNSPDVVVKKVTNFFLGGAGTRSSGANDNWFVPKGVALKFKPKDKIKLSGNSFTDILDLSQVGLHKYANGKFSGVNRLPGACLIKSMPSTGTVWSVLQFLQNAAINEMYTELVPDSSGKLRPMLILRQMPFSNKDSHETNVFASNFFYTKKRIKDGISTSEKTYFVDLPKYSIVSSDVKQKNIGKSDHERINYIMVVPKIDSSTLDIGYVAGVNVPSVQRYGLKTFQSQTSYVLDSTGGGAGVDGIKRYCQRCVFLLQDWFFLSHNMFNGSILVDGVDKHVPVGTNLYISDIKQLFHIEGYTHNYEIAETGETIYNTEFRISRGQVFTGTTAKFIGISQSPNDPTTIAVSFLAADRRTDNAKA